MDRVVQYLGIAVILLGVVTMVLGGIFVNVAFSKGDMLKDEMVAEQVSYMLPEEEVAAGNVVDNASEAKLVAEAVREHRRGIAATYGDLGRFDPSNPDHLSYAQAMNMENYLYLGVMGFGVVDLATGVGAAMLIIGLGITVAGVVLLIISRKMLTQLA